MVNTNVLVIFDAFDCERILNALYKGQRPEHVHTLICSCGAVADLRQDPSAWNDWMILPHAKCPACLDAERKRALQLERDPALARARYMGLIHQLDLRKAG